MIVMDSLEGANGVVGMVTKKAQLAQFEQIPEVKEWVDGIDIKASTRSYYVKRLHQYLAGESPKAFVDRALKNPRDTAIEIKKRITPLSKKSPSVAFHVRAAVKSYLEFYETDVHITGKLKVRRTWEKHYLQWHDAEKIIAKCRAPYESTFRFMLWAGLGIDEVLEINGSAKIQKQIADQLQNDKDYVVIDLEPRKQTLTRYFTVVPKGYVPEFPIYSLDYKIRGNKLISGQVLECRFRKAAEEVGLYKPGLGPHTLRSAFKSACREAKINDNFSEFIMGHGSGDRYGYAREMLDEENVVKELRKLWKGEGARIDQVAEDNKRLVEENEQFKARIKKLETQSEGTAATLSDPEKLRELVEKAFESGMVQLVRGGEPTPEEVERERKLGTQGYQAWLARQKRKKKS